MTDGGHGPDGPGDREDPGPGELPPELRGLDEELRSIRFGPRPGLEEDVAARISGAARDRRRLAPGRATGFRATARIAAAVLAAVVVLGQLGRLGPPRSGTPDRTAAPDPAAGEVAADRDTLDGWAMRWGSDDRVLTMGRSLRPAVGPPGRAPSGRGLQCGRVGDRFVCRGSELDAPERAGARGGAVLRDFCCLDYDGGGKADDGVRVVAGRREAVLDFWIYEDRDGTRSFSAGDHLRGVLPAVPTPGGPRAASGARRLDHCCADLDGGPRPDDGIFVVAGGREQVALAVLYEDETGDGRLGPGDRLRAVRVERGAELGGGIVRDPSRESERGEGAENE